MVRVLVTSRPLRDIWNRSEWENVGRAREALHNRQTLCIFTIDQSRQSKGAQGVPSGWRTSPRGTEPLSPASAPRWTVDAVLWVP